MKKIISVFVFAALISVAAFAQKEGKKDDAWRDKVRAEQVAFITSELDLSEAEAQKFWPVYNEVQSKRREAYKESFDAMNALKENLQNGEDTEKNLEKYLEARKKIQALDDEAVKKYSKVLPMDKVAKLVLSEERFRHKQIGKLGGNNGHMMGQGAPQGAPKGERQGGHKNGHKGGKFQPGAAGQSVQE